MRRNPGGYIGEQLPPTPKRKAGTSPTARTLSLLRGQGYTAGVVERYNRFSRTRHDLGGCIDIVAWKPGHGIVGIQACAGASHAARLTKAKEQPGLTTWLAAGGKFAVISWAKQGARGKRKLWTDRWEWVSAADAAEGK